MQEKDVQLPKAWLMMLKVMAGIMHDHAEYDEQFETECEVPSSNNENNTQKTNAEEDEDKENEEEDEDEKEEIEEENQEENEIVLRPTKAKKT